MFRIWAMLALFVWAQVTFATESVVLANDPWPPYAIGVEANGQVATKGIAIALINLIFRRLDNVDAKVLLVLWRKVLSGVEKGHFDGVPLLFKTPERESYMHFSEPLFQARTLFFYNAETYPEGIQWQSYQDLVDYRIAVQHSFSIAETFDRQIANGISLKVEKMNSDRDCFRLLALGRVDLVATNEIVGQEYLKQLGVSDQFKASTQSLYQKPFYIGFSKMTDAHTLIPQINAIISQLRQGGEIDRIVYQSR